MPAGEDVRVPDPALALELPFGRSLTLGDLRGAPALLVLVPLAFSPICTRELRELDAARPLLAPARVIVISCDAAASLHAWREHERAEVEVASDFWPHGAVASALGAFEEARGWPRRRTVLLDADGAPRWSDEAPPGRARDVADAVAAVTALVAGSVD